MTQRAVETKSNREQITFTEAFSTFSAKNIAKEKEFYGTKLGLDVSEDEMGGISLTFGNGQSVFIYPKDDHEAATFTVLNLTVNDIAEAVDQLIERGVKFEKYGGKIETDEKGIHWGKKTNEGPNIAWFKDPAGNILSVIEG